MLPRARSVCFPSLVSLALLMPTACATARAQGPVAVPASEARNLRHQSPQWLAVVGHLPDRATADPKQLEMAADVLRARRLPEDAVEFYTAALDRGGDPGHLFNSIGITELELQHLSAAHIYFERVVKLRKKSADAWNNLGATEYLGKNYGGAIKDYKRAIGLDKEKAAFHSNLATAYFEKNDMEQARRQYAIALQMDPELFQHGSGSGVVAHVLSPQNRAKFCLEMAKLMLSRKDHAATMHWLAMASEGGMDLSDVLAKDPVLSALVKDPDVGILIANARALQTKQVAKVSAPQLPAATPQ